jgi:DNA-binding NarL/FixJ family response regulator
MAGMAIDFKEGTAGIFLATIRDQSLSKAGLTPKEQDIARLLLKGLSTPEIAKTVGNSEKTVKQHISVIYEKSGVHSRPEFFYHVFPH